MTKNDPTDQTGNQLSVLKPEMLVGPMQPLPVKTKQFAPHGHIVRADPNAAPTDVVEISEDIFEKEIYRENQDTEADKELGMSQYSAMIRNMPRGYKTFHTQLS